MNKICGEEKDTKEFYKDGDKKDGYSCNCKSCKSKSQKNRYKRNKKKIREQQKGYRMKDPVKTKIGNIKRKIKQLYKITITDYENMYNSQKW